MPPTSETKNAYWWNTPRSRGLTRTSGTAAAGIRPPREVVVDRSRRSMGIRDSGLGAASVLGHAATVRPPTSSQWDPLGQRHMTGEPADPRRLPGA
jgi:hypothetical protein